MRIFRCDLRCGNVIWDVWKSLGLVDKSLLLQHKSTDLELLVRGVVELRVYYWHDCWHFQANARYEK